MFDSVIKTKSADNVYFNYHKEDRSDDITKLLQGLQAPQKTINPKYFYDTQGSELFEKITQLPEYYPTRTEKHLLSHHAQEIAQYCEEQVILIEPGSGNSDKVRLLLAALKPKSYVPMDISAEFLQRAANQLGEKYPWLDIHAICTDFSQSPPLPNELPQGKRIIFYPGSTLGNMTPPQAIHYLNQLRQWIDGNNSQQKGGILIGIDLHKSSQQLNAAYNDAAGITAAFNLNILSHVNRLVDGNFDKQKFEHLAFYNEKQHRIEMHLVSNIDHIVHLNKHALTFKKGERIHTENSYKYTLDSFNSLVNKANLSVKKTWIDEDSLFSVHYLSSI
ncbi:L-histidine N(alpha)-methyltransferase [uncultured Shewanella sp.]|uniref:L-histidine N(alpha)-methyltransferase n=1 Tax=uncultured Shewanella sp. TaxID=173975 RepID=UPI0026016B15|nr:L-histidine N(alpha)-methyltransferase [uncultured Shewanella sp.]